MTDDTNEPAFTRIPRWTGRAGGEPGTAVHLSPVPAGLAAALRHTAAALGVPAAAVLTAAHARVLATVTAEADLLIGHVPDEQGAAETPLRLHVTGSSWARLVAEADRATRAEHPAGAGREVLLDLSGLTAGLPPAPGGSLEAGTVLRIRWERDGDGLALRVVHDRTVVDAAHAERLAGYHLTALRLLTDDPAARHDRQSLLSEAEVDTQLHGLAGPRTELPRRTFMHLFQDRVRSAPQAIAAEHGAQSWTYEELDARANRITHALLAAGLNAEDVVAVVMDRSLDWIAATLGVLKAGGIYLPVRPDFPVDRVAAQLDRSACAFALTEPGSEELVRRAGATLTTPPVPLSVPDVQAGEWPVTPAEVTVDPGRAAYIYFTSGSTGAPKGALCEHAGMLNHLYMKVEDMDLRDGPGDVVAQTASQCFDISLWQVAAPLMTGGAVRVVDTRTQLDVTDFLDEITAGRVTQVQIVPSYLEVLLTHLERDRRDLAPLRAVSVTGEALKYDLVARWFALYPDIKLVNGYGATEVSDDTMHEVLERAPESGTVTVGRSLRNVNTYVLDENLQLVPLGSVGEIAFSGVCVGRGYINDEERTREAFVADPFRADTRMYRTGDFGRWLPEGSIEFLGRRDEQVKIRGFRIEIGDIENKLSTMAGMREAAVVVDGAAGEQRNLVAFFSAVEAVPGEQVHDFLAARLPDYMMPAYVHQLERLPLTENGKVDKKALVELAGMLGHGDAPYVAPVTASEQRLAMLWAEVLGVPVERVGRNDGFFDLGGTSLAAVRLLVRLERAISLKDLMAQPVLVDLAAVLDARRSGGESAAATTLVQPLSSVPAPHHTLVCFPYAGGNAVNFRSLATELGHDGTAVLGVELPGHDLADGEALQDVPTVARRVRDEITERVRTPVLLWGHGAGAAIAAETARLLEEAGTPAERLFIGACLLEETDVLRAEMAEVDTAQDAALLERLRAGSAYVELDALQPERAGVVGRAYRHDVLAAGRHLIGIRENPAAHHLRTPVHVVLARDDAATAADPAGHGGWKALADEVTLHQLDEGGPYFVSTRAADTAALVRSFRLRSERLGRAQ
ncbi:amino acid adenylation domain-containing protein [Streptomyces massasporeus]|uniref:non-ribosomal peptide synthetase family protein n=1 Tax=Streptomyces massasporeus TaxID=67324 RepID=UPI0036E92A7B